MRAPRRVALAVASAIALLSPAVALAGPPTDPNHPELSQTLARLAAPGLRNESPDDQARALSLPESGPGSLARDGDRLGVEIIFKDGAGAAVDELEAAGARVEFVSRRYQSVTASVDPAALRAVSNVHGVARVWEASVPLVAGADTPAPDQGSQTGAAGCGSVNSEGDAQLNADDLRTGLGVDGTGVKVGVISDSYDLNTSASTHATQDVTSGDLPGVGNPCGFNTPVDVVADTHTTFGRTDEGRAMLQIVHDLAPGSPLAFADSAISQPQFADRIKALKTAGSKVIVDDITYLDEPFFQKGAIDNAVDEVAGQGVAYFSDAANNNVIFGGNNVASWEAPAYRPTTCPPDVLLQPDPPDSCMDFDPGPGTDNALDVSFASANGQNVTLQWAEPWDGVQTDLDFYLLSGGTVNQTVSNAGPSAGGTGSRSVARMSFDSTGGARQLVVGRYSGPGGGSGTTTPRLKIQFLNNGLQGSRLTEYLTSANGDTTGPTIFGHNGAENGSSVAAVRFDDNTRLEDFSARGPVTHYFGPFTGSNPAPALATPQVLSKPDITATDGNSTTFFGQTYGSPPTPNHFFGTSAAAPHAAAVAALQLQVDPALTPAEIRALQAGNARPVGSFGTVAIGAGLIDALAAGPRPRVTLSGPPAFTNDTTPGFTFAVNRGLTPVCTLDGASAPSCASPATAPALTDGPHTFAVSATDAIGHTGSQTSSFTVDTVAPDATISGGPSGPTKNARPTFSVASGDVTAALTCQIDANAAAPCAGSFQPAAKLGNGRHTVTLRATDPATNAGTATRTFKVDTVKPKVSFKKHPAKKTRKRKATFTYKASESGVTFTCKIDKKPAKKCGKKTRLKRLKKGKRKFTVTALDAAGNSGRKSFSWRVK